MLSVTTLTRPLDFTKQEKLRMEPLPDLAGMDKKALESLLMELYERSCKMFGDTFDVMHQVKVR